MEFALQLAASPGLEAALTGYRRCLLGRSASGERLIRAELARLEAESSPLCAEARLLLSLALRARGAWADAIAALKEVLRAPSSPPTQALAVVALADALVQAGRIEELRAWVQSAASRWPPSVADLANATLRAGLGEGPEAIALVAGARKALLPPEVEGWAQALHVDLLIERALWAEARAELGGSVESRLARGFNEVQVRLLVADARLAVESLCAASQPVPGEQLKTARRTLALALGYTTNMPLYRGVMEATEGLLRTHLGLADGQSVVLDAAEALERNGSTFEAARVLGRLASLWSAQQRLRAVPVAARARDLFVRAGAFARVAASASANGSEQSPSLMVSTATGAGRTTFGGTSIIGLELEKDVELQALFEVAREMASSREVAAVLQKIVQSAVRVLKAERGVLMQKQPDGTLVCVAAQGIPTAQVREETQEISFSVLRECEAQGVAILTDNALTDARFRAQGSVLASDLRSIACAPMVTAKQSLGFLYIDSTVTARAFTQLTKETLAVFAAQAAVALENALAFEEIDGLTRGLERRVAERSRELTEALEHLTTSRLATAEAQRDALEKEMRLARSIQMSAVPPATRIDTVAASFAGVVEPASFCGGDFWACGSLDEDRAFVMVGDVTGHGVAAALLTAVAKSCLDTLLATRAAHSPSEFLGRLNDAIYESGKGELQMTAWMGVLHRSTRSLVYANAAHNFPLYLDLSQKIPRLDVCAARGDTLGEERGVRYAEHKRTWQPADALVLFTDGLVECTDAAGRGWGENRLRRLVAEQRDFEPVALRDAITGAAWTHFGAHPRDDDVTVVVAGLR